MKKEYDFSKAKKNPYFRNLKQRTAIGLNTDGLSLAYQEMASDKKREQEAIDWSEGVIGDCD